MLLNRQLLFYYTTLAVSAGYLIFALSLGAPTSESGLTPSFFPILVGAAAVLFSAVLILQQLRAGQPAPATPAVETPRNWTHLGVAAAVFVYILAFKPLGYFLSSGLFVLAIILLFSSFEKLLQKAALSAAITGIAYVMFQQLFGVRLPTFWG